MAGEDCPREDVEGELHGHGRRVSQETTRPGLPSQHEPRIGWRRTLIRSCTSNIMSKVIATFNSKYVLQCPRRKSELGVDGREEVHLGRHEGNNQVRWWRQGFKKRASCRWFLAHPGSGVW